MEEGEPVRRLSRILTGALKEKAASRADLLMMQTERLAENLYRYTEPSRVVLLLLLRLYPRVEGFRSVFCS